MSKEKTKYKIISVNTASSSADISTKILQDARCYRCKLQMDVTPNLWFK